MGGQLQRAGSAALGARAHCNQVWATVPPPSRCARHLPRKTRGRKTVCARRYFPPPQVGDRGRIESNRSQTALAGEFASSEREANPDLSRELWLRRVKDLRRAARSKICAV